MILRGADTILIAMMVAAAAWTYQVKHEAEDKLAEIRSLDRAISAERDTIDLLKADLSYLVQPVRLQAIVEAHASQLGLQPLDATQIAHRNELPARMVDLEPPVQSGDDGEMVAAPDAAAIKTGSVKR